MLKDENLPAVHKPANLPAGIDPEDYKRIREEDLKRSMEGVIPRLQQIKVLHAGALMFKFPADETGKEERREFFDGVIADSHLCRAWWKKSYEESGGGQRPDCSSLDALTGTKFVKCSECEYSKDNTGPKGEGTACKLMRRIHIFMEGSLLPYRLTVTITSIPIFDHFSTILRTKGLYVYDHILHFSLDEAVSKEGFKYSKLHLNVVRQLEPENYLRLRDILMSIEPQIRGQEIMRAEYEDVPQPGNVEDLESPIPPEDLDSEIEKDENMPF